MTYRSYQFVDGRGERYTVRASSEHAAWKKFVKQSGYTKDNTDILANDFSPNVVDRQTCEENNGIWVPEYHQKDGTRVRGYCRGYRK